MQLSQKTLIFILNQLTIFLVINGLSNIFVEEQNMSLDVPRIKEMMTDPLRCFLECQRMESCFSVNLEIQKSSSGKQVCELLPTDVTREPRLVRNDSFNYFYLPNVCASMASSCKKVNTVKPLTNKNGSCACLCKAGFTGLECESEIGECESSPCLNGGTCTNHVNYFHCECRAGYAGKQCQTDIDECASSPCLNGSTCEDGVNGYTCSCVVGYSGPQCGSHVCSTAPCFNGGTCIKNTGASTGYNCSCPSNYFGTQCEKTWRKVSGKVCDKAGWLGWLLVKADECKTRCLARMVCHGNHLDFQTFT
ncbi:fibropellin-3 isoform X2 [Nematostella vectensis]|uniref:fibropellin-3 isoform X2 n=1 Tax=Nematostella vectensis TaxID=45351 RepID=UPI0020775AC3|nr:fibropellin-3 isoform X2 [Nematostella vectensis]